MKKKKEENEIYREIGSRLRAAREKIGFSLLHVSGVFGIGYQSLRRYEAGQTAIPIDLLYSLAEYFNIKPGDLLPEGGGIKNKKFDDKVQLDKNIFQLRKIYAGENEKAKRITNAVIDFLASFADEI